MAIYTMKDKNGNTTNLIEWDGKAELILPADTVLEKFTPLPQPPEPIPIDPGPRPDTPVEVLQKEVAAIKEKLGML